MKQKLFFITFSLLLAAGLGLLMAQPVQAFDARVLKVHQFLLKQDSPLADYSADFVQEADNSGLDYRLLVAISGVESTFGKNYISGTYNAYGWGVGQIPFTSWYDGIVKVSQGLKNQYINKGAKNVDQIAKIYCPPTSDHWAQSVKYFITQIENTDITNPTIAANSTPQLPLSI